MEEQILKMIEHPIFPKEMMGDVTITPQVAAAKEITEHVMAFAVWFACESFNCFESGTIDDKIYFTNMDGEDVTPDDVYKFWDENINGK